MVSPTRVVPAAERGRLAALRALKLLDAPLNDRFERVVDAVQREFGVPIACLTLIDADRQFMAAHRGMPARETPLEGTFCATAMWSPEPFVIPDMTLEPRFNTSPYVQHDPGIRFYASQALYAPTGEPIGTLCVMDTQTHELADEQVRVLAELGRWAQQEIFETVGQKATPELHARFLGSEPADAFTILSLPAPATQRSHARFYDWIPVAHGLLFGVGGVHAPADRTAPASVVVRCALRGAHLDPDPPVALEVAARQLVDELDGLGATPEVFLGRLDTADGRLDWLALGRTLAVVVHADGSYDRLTPTGGDGGVTVASDTVHHRDARSVRGRSPAGDVRGIRAALTGRRPSERATGPVGATTGTTAAGVARTVSMRAHDTLICGTLEWADLDAATIGRLAELAATATLRDVRTHLRQLQRARGLTGACGLLLRHEPG